MDDNRVLELFQNIRRLRRRLVLALMREALLEQRQEPLCIRTVDQEALAQWFGMRTSFGGWKNQRDLLRKRLVKKQAPPELLLHFQSYEQFLYRARVQCDALLRQTPGAKLCGCHLLRRVLQQVFHDQGHEDDSDDDLKIDTFSMQKFQWKYDTVQAVEVSQQHLPKLHATIRTRIEQGSVRGALILIHEQLFEAYQRADNVVLLLQKDQDNNNNRQLLTIRNEIAGLWLLYAHVLLELSDVSGSLFQGCAEQARQVLTTARRCPLVGNHGWITIACIRLQLQQPNANNVGACLQLCDTLLEMAHANAVRSSGGTMRTGKDEWMMVLSNIATQDTASYPELKASVEKLSRLHASLPTLEKRHLFRDQTCSVLICHEMNRLSECASRHCGTFVTRCYPDSGLEAFPLLRASVIYGPTKALLPRECIPPAIHCSYTRSMFLKEQRVACANGRKRVKAKETGRKQRRERGIGQGNSVLCRTTRNFVLRLYQMVSDSDENIQWNDAGDRFVIIGSVASMEEDTIPRYFEHGRHSSFLRQLNLYQFEKIKPKTFRHPKFHRDKPEDLPLVRRPRPDGRVSTKKRSLNATGATRNGKKRAAIEATPSGKPESVSDSSAEAMWPFAECSLLTQNAPTGVYVTPIPSARRMRKVTS